MGLEFVKCNNCGSDKSTIFISGHDYTTIENENDNDNASFVFNTCELCGLIYQNPRPTSSSINRYYPESYSPYNKRGNYLRIFERIINYKKKCVLDYLQSGNLLDIGCAGGDFLHDMRTNSQFIVSGVEFSPFASQRARDEFGLNVFTGDLLEANYPDEYYDVVTVWNVLEHVFDPTSTIKEIHRILKPGGYLIVRVPNPDSFAAKVFGKYWAGLDFPRHLFLFPRNILINMAKDAGFSIKKTYFWGYMWPTSIKYWFNRRFISRNDVRSLSDQFILQLSRTLVIRLIFFPFWEMINRAGSGENMTLVFKK